MSTDKIIDLLDKHADKAMEYLKMNKGTENTDLDTRTVIWNQMSALLAVFDNSALPPSPDYVRGQERMRERAASAAQSVSLSKASVEGALAMRDATVSAIRSLPLEDAGEGAKLTSHPFGPPFLYGPRLCHCGFPEGAHAPASPPTPSPSPAPAGEGTEKP